MKWLLEYEKFNSDLWTGPYSGVSSEQNLLILPIDVVYPIHFDLTIDPYVSFIG